MTAKRVRTTPRTPATTGLAAGVLAVLGATTSGGQPSPQGPQFQLNSYTTDSQYGAGLAVADDGRFVVVWTSWGGGTDTNESSIQARLFAASGIPLGEEFQVNTYTPGRQFSPAVAADAQGNFVVVWTSIGSAGSDYGSSVQAQRFAASGEPVGGELQVNTFTPGLQRNPQVAMGGPGGFVVAWWSDGSGGTDGSAFSVQARLYDAGGSPAGDEFQVNTLTTNVQWYPAVAADDQGDFVVAWQSSVSSGTDTEFSSIQARRFDSNGVPQGPEFQVNTHTPDSQYQAAVAMAGAGSFVVAWASGASSGTDSSYTSIQAQRFDAGGDPVGAQFQVNTYTDDYQFGPDVTVDEAGGFVIVWHSHGSDSTDVDLESVQARRYLPNGSSDDLQFEVNSYTTSRQVSPEVAADGRGNFVVAWDSLGSYGTDSSSWSVQGQRFDGLFRDGFESGDSERWSIVAPRALGRRAAGIGD